VKNAAPGPRCGAGCAAAAPAAARANCFDLPAYLVIVIVGHFVVPMILWIETDYAPSVPLQLAIYLPFTLVASLLLLQPVKGAVVGLQWAFRMHGFDENDPEYKDPLDKKNQRE
jgi:uncharacterized protein (DUF983 family)